MAVASFLERKINKSTGSDLSVTRCSNTVGGCVIRSVVTAFDLQHHCSLQAVQQEHKFIFSCFLLMSLFPLLIFFRMLDCFLKATFSLLQFSAALKIDCSQITEFIPCNRLLNKMK